LYVHAAFCMSILDVTSLIVAAGHFQIILVGLLNEKKSFQVSIVCPRHGISIFWLAQVLIERADLRYKFRNLCSGKRRRNVNL